MRLLQMIVAAGILAQMASCQGRGRRDLTIKPKPNAQDVAKQEFEAVMPVTFSGGSGKAVPSVTLTNLLCDNAISYSLKSYVKNADRGGDLHVSVMVPLKTKTLTCTELGVQTTDSQDIYDAPFNQTTTVDATGVFSFATIALDFSKAGEVKDTPGNGTSTNKGGDDNTTITVDGTIQECPKGQTFDVKTGKCQ